MSETIDTILDAAEQREASDVFLQEDEIPRLKINEQITVFGEERMSLAEIAAFWQACGAHALPCEFAPHHGPARCGPATHQDQRACIESARSAGVAPAAMGRSRARPD